MPFFPAEKRLKNTETFLRVFGKLLPDFPQIYTYTESGEKVQLKRWDPRSTMRKVSNTLAMAPKARNAKLFKRCKRGEVGKQTIGGESLLIIN